jgi:hypothetical protein
MIAPLIRDDVCEFLFLALVQRHVRSCSLLRLPHRGADQARTELVKRHSSGFEYRKPYQDGMEKVPPIRTVSRRAGRGAQRKRDAVSL